MLKQLALSLTGIALLAAVPAANATAVTLSASSGSHGASVTFDVDGSGNLVVTLANTSSTAALIPVDILTGVFFTMTPNTALTPLTAKISPLSTLVGGVLVDPPPNGVGGEWAYKGGGGILVPLTAFTQGISSSGLGIFGAGDRFPGADLINPASPDGLQYGILPTAGIGVGANAAVTGTALVQNSVTFTLSGIAPGFDPLTAITSVRFQYGTALDEGHIDCCGGGNVPDSGNAVILFGLSLLSLGGLSFYYRRQRAA